MRCHAERERERERNGGIIHEKLQRQGPFGFIYTHTHKHTNSHTDTRMHAHTHIYRPADGLVSGVVWWQNG